MTCLVELHPPPSARPIYQGQPSVCLPEKPTRGDAMRIRGKCLLMGSMAAAMLGACAHGPEGYQRPGARPESVLVVKTEQAEKLSLPGWELTLLLGARQDESVLEFLDKAEAAGARYVSDLSVVFPVSKEGQPLECRTRIQPAMAYRFTPATHSRSVWVQTLEQAPVFYDLQCDGPTCTQVPRQTAYQFVLRPAVDMPQRVQRSGRYLWQLQKSAPECTPLAEGESLASVTPRVEGHAYGCGSGASCEDRAL
jgi:hypothetical protein